VFVRDRKTQGKSICFKLKNVFELYSCETGLILGFKLKFMEIYQKDKRRWLEIFYCNFVAMNYEESCPKGVVRLLSHSFEGCSSRYCLSQFSQVAYGSWCCSIDRALLYELLGKVRFNVTEALHGAKFLNHLYGVHVTTADILIPYFIYVCTMYNSLTTTSAYFGLKPKS
jgi:hypothetical protein